MNFVTNTSIKHERREGKIVPTEKIVKIAGLNLGIAIFNTILFSPGLLGIRIGGTSIFSTAFGVTVILMSIIIFATGNYGIIAEKQKKIQANEIKTIEDYIYAFKQNIGKKTFSKDITLILEQIERFQRKKDTIKDILLQKFNSNEISYSKFEEAISAIGNIFFINVKSIFNKLNAFDEDDYYRVKKNDTEKKFSTEFIQSKMSIYNEYITYVKAAIEENEQILLKLDKLLLEISKFNCLEAGEIENMSGMKEIDELISKTKFYK